MNLPTKQKYSYRCRKQTYGYQGVTGRGINWETGIDKYTLLCIKYSTGNSTQYSVMSHMGKESKKERIYVFVNITDSLCCTPETNTTL